MNPKISVIMPVYNAEKYIGKAIKSILFQTFYDFELILIDDQGDDNSMHIAKSFSDQRIRIIHNHANSGISYSRNIGIHEAKGYYIALMDDDDIAPPDRLEAQVHFLECNKSIDIVGGKHIFIDTLDREMGYARPVICNPKRIWAELFFRDVIANGSTMIRKSFLLENDLHFKDGFYGMEDYMLWVECASKGAIANIEKLLLKHRMYSDNTTMHMNKNKQYERDEAYRKIQLHALELNNLTLTPEQKNIFFTSFKENKKNYISMDDLLQTIEVLKELIRQVSFLYSDKSQDFELVCKKMLALKTENSELWK